MPLGDWLVMVTFPFFPTIAQLLMGSIIMCIAFTVSLVFIRPPPADCIVRAGKELVERRPILVKRSLDYQPHLLQHYRRLGDESIESLRFPPMNSSSAMISVYDADVADHASDRRKNAVGVKKELSFRRVDARREVNVDGVAQLRCEPEQDRMLGARCYYYWGPLA